MLANMSLDIHKLLSHPSHCLFQSQQRSSTELNATVSQLKPIAFSRPCNGTKCIHKPPPRENLQINALLEQLKVSLA